GMGIIPLDYLAAIPRFPELGGKADATHMTVQGGGPVPNAMVGLARMGCRTAVIAAIGDDHPGQVLLAELAREGVETAHMIVKKRTPSATAYGFIEPDGRRTIVLHRRIFIEPRDLRLSHYPVPRVLHLDGRDIEATVRLARWGKRAGATVTFDIGSMRNDVTPVLPLVDHLVVADSWALPYTGERETPRALARLAEICGGTVVITEGIRGATGLEAGRRSHHPAYRIEAVDTTGAGDAFHAGYLYGLLRGKDMAERLRLGSAAAALKCTRPGARGGMPTLSQLRKFLQRPPETYA
ncbi:MAG TPA: PfkB family carbohydrate kinase, partial [candidate division Zixibacteria bacterium]|nr:PfkB family carbohydrate kinase [candidate division Zixibacteria bacterium]